MRKQHLLLFGCGGVALAFVAVVVSLVGWLWYLGQDPKGVAISVEGPQTVAVGEEFDLTVVVRNWRVGDSFELSDIDVAEEYLEGFLILGTEPEAKSSMHVPIDNTRSYSFDTPIPPGQTKRYRFRLRAAAQGLFRGDVDVCEGSRFLSTPTQTMVVGGR
jgi:hypothetical protein